MINRLSKDFKAYFKNLAIPLTSFVILIFLVFQTVASFNLIGRTVHKYYGSPFLFPFLDYPMYDAPHYEGDTLKQYFVFGTLEDLTEVPIVPEDLGLHFWLFRRGFVFALLKDDYDEIKNYAALYEKRHNKRLIGLRLENHPLVLSRDGVDPGVKQTLKNFRLETLGK